MLPRGRISGKRNTSYQVPKVEYGLGIKNAKTSVAGTEGAKKRVTRSENGE